MEALLVLEDGTTFRGRFHSASPRKQMANSLAYGLKISKADVARLLAKGDIASQRRAETLTLEEWAQLWQAYAQWEGKKSPC